MAERKPKKTDSDRETATEPGNAEEMPRRDKPPEPFDEESLERVVRDCPL